MITCVSARLCSGILLCGSLVLLLGCDTKPARGTVKGKVTLGDKPLTVGNVIFLAKDNADNVTGTAKIDNDGNYVLNDAPVGETKIAVQVPKLPPGGLEMMRRMKNSPGMKDTGSVDPNDKSKSISIMGDIPADFVPIPDKYADLETSGLTYTVKKGEQTHDIQLTP